ncbi:hypothetical protein DPMN_096417 [Dreissena polymorpha]|uniref:THAP-type domain-containing protein n=1 Tax=Dreissena polymorpha TaxID=45954 RepID=A0A9D4L8B1_DREPO|nr:hypothetical protein DPMN_096417 [Dreissena polymorpha]
MVQCAAFGCNARSEKQTEKKGFFGFSKDESIKRKWIQAVNSRRIIDGKVVDFTPSKYAKLCIKHFEDKCFVHPRPECDGECWLWGGLWDETVAAS